MCRLAIIGGSGISALPFLKDKKVFFLNRHGKNRNIPPHKINHKKNLLKIKSMEIKKVIGVNSVGSLKLNIKPGSIIVPDDYINLKNIQTYYDIKAKHITPGLDETLRKEIINVAKRAKIRVIKKGIYIQTIGPRLETKAEINMLKDYGDIVGMTMANEATLAKELGLRYASICMVDNYANGIIKKPLTFEMIKKTQKRNQKRIARLLRELIK